ncbi:uncharacterized protein N7500_008713 [Penicillium coprophilum]|uniref:uncharacterized protein n=1 Tax=Penicillium coprophilum TaxID=36646 RepID=UPI002397CB9B|nr:uncharacterized protein N7500_008713 [Penicillium coprophilum]KAJ5159062.1 hypothetical protein N7500_008713 [Penicillium coprophilum]
MEMDIPSSLTFHHFFEFLPYIIFLPSKRSTYDHRVWKTGLPVRSALKYIPRTEYPESTLGASHKKEKKGNTIYYPKLAPTTLEKYNRIRISRNESIYPNFPNLPIPTPELLKLFVEFYIKSTELIVDYKLCIKPRERFLVNRKDIAYLLRHLFVDNYHNYIYKRVIVYRVADSAFKGLTTITEVLTVKLPNGREL